MEIIIFNILRILKLFLFTYYIQNIIESLIYYSECIFTILCLTLLKVNGDVYVSYNFNVFLCKLRATASFLLKMLNAMLIISSSLLSLNETCMTFPFLQNYILLCS